MILEGVVLEYVLTYNLDSEGLLNIVVHWVLEPCGVGVPCCSVWLRVAKFVAQKFICTRAVALIMSSSHDQIKQTGLRD